nr:FAD-dependent oxidoreductase [uncultured Tateyamaria sp.]
MITPGNLRKKVVLVGGGHTHALVLHVLKRDPLRNVDLTVINPGKTAPYSGMLPGFVAGHYQRDDLDIDLQELADRVGATLIDGRAVGMDVDEGHVILQDKTRLPYDLASVDVGITSHMKALPGFAENGIPAKPLAEFASRWDTYRSAEGPKNAAIIGGGIAGAEIAMAMAFALRNDPNDVSIKLLDRSQILSHNSKTAQRLVRQALLRNSVELLEGANVAEVTPSSVVFTDGTSIDANFVVGAAGATPHDWVRNTGLHLKNGFIEVDATLQTSAPGVFAVGDCAHMSFDPRPKAGVFAVRQAPVLTANLHLSLSGGALRTYQPQSDYLKLVSLGGKHAFGEKTGYGFSGHLMWRLKDKIDRDFMRQFSA